MIAGDKINNKNIALTGFMGTGKTAVGEILAAKLNRTFVDTDQIIENASGMTIAQIFEKYGEKYFRDRESEVIADLDKYKPGSLVIATGGGIVLKDENINNLMQNGLIVLLTATPQAIYTRVSETNQRPILSGSVSVENITVILKEREEHYNKYSFRVDTTKRNPAQVAAIIVAYLNKL